MKRSRINQAIREMEKLVAQVGFELPPFCSYTPQQWAKLDHDYDEIRDCRLGWDITDYGAGRFEDLGFSLITLRNGRHGDPRYRKTYAEKLLMLREGQIAPMHFHFSKMEDIINRGGGMLLIRVYRSNEHKDYDDEPVTVSCDGVERVFEPGHEIRLTPGESITIPPYLYHDFKVEPGTGAVLIGEVSMVNDDDRDNHFRDGLGRFPAIEEDEPPHRLLCTEYPPAP